VPLTFVLYHPASTPSRSDSSIVTRRGDKFCMEDRFLSRRSTIERCQGFGCSEVTTFAQPSWDSRASSGSSVVGRARIDALRGPQRAIDGLNPEGMRERDSIPS
jgi:hypothetical protein